jgi:hypothetical protein
MRKQVSKIGKHQEIEQVLSWEESIPGKPILALNGATRAAKRRRVREWAGR